MGWGVWGGVGWGACWIVRCVGGGGTVGYVDTVGCVLHVLVNVFCECVPSTSRHK